ncbi:MAG: hypothetical protein AMXMBFR4_07490 [Candidatus Hydrogenedentota bacterium]
MSETHEACVCGRVFEVQAANLAEDLRELKQRVEKLETTLGRGVMLLLANLAGVVVTLAQQLLHA